MPPSPTLPKPRHAYLAQKRKEHQQAGKDASSSTYDYIVIGSGPASAGFINKLLSLKREARMNLRRRRHRHVSPGGRAAIPSRPALQVSVLWFEEGERIGKYGQGIVGWPDELQPQISKGNIPDHRFTTRNWLRARSWKGFGGGDAMNSGGPNYLGLQQDDTVLEPNVWELRNQNIIEGKSSFGTTPLGDRFIGAFQGAEGFVGYEMQTPLPTDAPAISMAGSGFVGYPSSIYPSSQRRNFLAHRLAQEFSAGPGRRSLHLRTKVVRLLVEEAPDGGKRVSGVAVLPPGGGGEVVYRAHSTILSAGIFGTFSLLVDSGIGPPEALDTRGISPSRRVIENPHIGKEVGDEVIVTCLFVAAEDQGGPPPQGHVAPLVGARAGDQFLRRTALVVWARGLPTIFALITRMWLVFRLLLTPFARNWSYISVSLDSLDPVTRKPTMALRATKHSVEVDDSRLDFTPEMMGWYESQLPALKEFFRLNNEAPQSCWRRWHRFWLRFLTPLIHSSIGRCVGMPPGVTEWNLHIKPTKKELGTYNHFYGGCQPVTVLNDKFELYLHPPALGKTAEENRCRPALAGLHIADASVIPQLTPGAPSATVMEWGMRVADRLCFVEGV